MAKKYEYVIRQCPINTPYCFRNFDFAMEHNWKLADYVTVYAGKVDGETVNDTLEKLFYIFNEKRPEDYFGRSLSKSDVVRLDGKYYYCDWLGWSECPAER